MSIKNEYAVGSLFSVENNGIYKKLDNNKQMMYMIT